MNGLQISKHAAARVVQRSIRRDDLAVILDEGNWAEHQRDGAGALRLLRRDIPDAIERGVPRDAAERAAKVTVIVSGFGTVLTAYRRGSRSDRIQSSRKRFNRGARR